MKKTFRIYIIATILIVLLLIGGCQKKYTVTFMDYNGTVLSEQIVKQSEDATAPTIPLREGYEFIGWSKEYTNIQEDIILIAQYKKVINTYTVRFLDYDNTLLKTEQIEENGNAIPPSTPSREGYKFIGWNNDYTNVQDDIIITAQYEKIINTYTVSFISYDNIIVETQSVEKGEKALEPTAPLREGYIFNGWYLNEEKWSFIGYSITSDIILEAKWTAIQYNIMYELNGGETSNPNTYTVEDKIILTNPKKTGYTFLGWTTEESDTPILDVSFSNETGNKTFTANYQTNVYNISYQLNGGETNNPTTYTVEDKIILTNPNKTGYTFLGWTTEESDTPILDVSFSNETGNKTFTANYQINVYNISYELNGGIANNPTTYTVEDKIILTNPKKTEYTFLGWTTEESDTPILELSFSNETGNKTFTANWINLSFVLTENDEYEISGMTNTYDSKVIVPEYYNKKKIVSIGDSAFYDCTSLTSITIPEGVTSIGDSAFFNCYNLTSITIPESVISIGDCAFFNCDSLTSITIPEGVTSIGDYAFVNCDNFTSINVSENNQYYKSIDGNLYSKDGKTLIQYAIGKQEKTFKIPNSVTSIGDYAFYSCTSLTNIIIPEGVTSIGDYAFYGCHSLTNITIPEGVTSIGDSAFNWCTSLTSITIPEGVTSICDEAFYNCISLISITIPESVTSIGDRTFYGCDSLTSINVSENNQYYKSIDGNLYSKDGKTLIQYAIGKQEKTFKIPNSVTSIGDSAFYSCDSLTSITIPESVISIGDSAFEYCRSLTSITIPGSVTSIGDSAFYYCYNLTSITIPESVTSLGVGAFYSCTSLTSINVSENNQYYKSIDGNLYSKDGKTLIQYALGKKDNNFIIPNSVTTIGTAAFAYCSSLVTIEIPNSVTTIGTVAFAYCSSLTSITIPEGVTIIGNGTFSDCESLTSITIPEGVTSIGDWAFYFCTSLTSITIPEGVTSIGEAAFYHCTSLTSITIPDSVTSIGAGAFADCYSLISITIPEGVTSIGDSAFYYCASLTSITIPEGVTSIGNCAFSCCYNLTSITIPEGITSIGDSAFSSCYYLTSIIIPESVTSIGDSVFSSCDSLTIYCVASSKPSGWSSGWNYDNRPVVWNCTL